MHGFAINVNTDLSYFDGIIPCGIFDYGVTSVEQLIESKLNVFDIAESVSELFLKKIKRAIKN